MTGEDCSTQEVVAFFQLGLPVQFCMHHIGQSKAFMAIHQARARPRPYVPAAPAQISIASSTVCPNQPRVGF